MNRAENAETPEERIAAAAKDFSSRMTKPHAGAPEDPLWRPDYADWLEELGPYVRLELARVKFDTLRKFGNFPEAIEALHDLNKAEFEVSKLKARK